MEKSGASRHMVIFNKEDFLFQDDHWTFEHWHWVHQLNLYVGSDRQRASFVCQANCVWRRDVDFDFKVTFCDIEVQIALKAMNERVFARPTLHEGTAQDSLGRTSQIVCDRVSSGTRITCSSDDNSVFVRCQTNGTSVPTRLVCTTYRDGIVRPIIELFDRYGHIDIKEIWPSCFGFKKIKSAGFVRHMKTLMDIWRPILLTTCLSQ